jgi:hypothetical protein
MNKILRYVLGGTLFRPPPTTPALEFSSINVYENKK